MERRERVRRDGRRVRSMMEGDRERVRLLRVVSTCGMLNARVSSTSCLCCSPFSCVSVN